ncbi:MAG: sulfotransferase domain-containing protein [Halieaceae bacterium]|nr:sulfotransferase domain-containing protein [Halieaceae bacterium]
MSSIVWLASYPKSGNTWMRAFLRNYLSDEPEPVDLNTQDPRFANENKPRWYQGFSDLPLESLNPTQVCALRPHAHARIAASRDGTVLTKTHNYLGDFDGFPLHNIEVTTGAIYIVRNPLDVVPSLADHFGMSLDGAIDFLAAEEAATQPDEANMGSILGSWSFHVASWTAEHSDVIRVVRYEDMLEQPEKTFSRVLRLLKLEPEQARLQRAIRHASFDSLQRLEQTRGFTERSEASERFFRTGRQGQWRDVLTDDQVAAVIAAHRSQMSRFGYLPEGY